MVAATATHRAPLSLALFLLHCLLRLPAAPRCSADVGSAQAALDTVNKSLLFGQEVRVNWAFQKEEKEEVAHHFHAFVGDLSSGGS